MNKRITDLSTKEITKIVSDIFEPEEISDIYINKIDNEIVVTISTRWVSHEDAIPQLCEDEITLHDPYDTDLIQSIEADFQIDESAFILWRQFCFAKGIYPDWMVDNPYIKTTETKTEA